MATLMMGSNLFASQIKVRESAVSTLNATSEVARLNGTTKVAQLKGTKLAPLNGITKVAPLNDTKLAPLNGSKLAPLNGTKVVPLDSCLPAISSHSLGRVFAGHDFIAKVYAAASHNFKGIELTYEDLDALACLRPGGPTPSNLIAAAHEIRKLTDSLSLAIVNLQPFAQYDGLISRIEHEKAIEKAKLWIEIANALGTTVILVPSNYLPAEECTSDLSTIVQDLTELADLGARANPPIRFAYENLCWGTHVYTWEAMHTVVSSVNRWNFGYCLDTFHIAGWVYADPASANGKTENAEVAMVDSLRRMVKCLDRKKIFFIQVADGERLSMPLTKEHPWYDPSQSARMTWSRNARLFTHEEERGGYLPILDVCRALFEGLEYKGWVSYELFSRTLVETNSGVPYEHVRRAERSWGRLTEAFPTMLGKAAKGDSVGVKKRERVAA